MRKHCNLACSFIVHAEEFCSAANYLTNKKPFLYHPTFYCALHSIELGLKAHLALSGFSKRRLASRALGHDLGALVSEAYIANAIPFLDPHARKAICFGAEDYSKKCFEYPEFMVSTLPVNRWLQIAEKLIERGRALIQTIE